MPKASMTRPLRTGVLKDGRTRSAVVLLLASLFLVILASAAGAAGKTSSLGELAQARSLAEQAFSAHKAGSSDKAYDLARRAYLDHFEVVEIDLRARDGSLTLKLEESFANFRNLIRSRAPVARVRSAHMQLRYDLSRAERKLSAPGVAAPVIALGYAAVLIFREGLEAVLVLAAVIGYLEASRSTGYAKPIFGGVVAAAVASVVMFVLAATLIRVAPFQRELIEALTALLAVAVLFYMSFWLSSRLEHRRWMEFLKARVWAAASTGSSLALAGVGFTAVFREGFETALFYQALLSYTEGLQIWVWMGTALGAIALTGVAVFVFRARRQLPIKAFLTTAVALIMTLSVAFLGNGMRGLQEAGFITATFLRQAPRLPIFVADLTGVHPTAETLVGQALLTCIYLGGALWVFVIVPRRRRGASPGTVPGRPQPAGDQ